MNRRTIPVFDLSEYRQPASSLSGFSIDTLEGSMARNPHRLRPHYHHFFQVFLALGTGDMMHDFIDYKIAGTTLIFMSPGHVHSVEPSPTLSGSFVSFSQEFFDNNAPPPSKLLDFPFFFSADTPPVLSLSGKESARCKTLFAEMQREYRAGLPGAPDVLRAYLQILFTRTLRLYLQTHQPRDPSRPAQLVRQFRVAVESRFRELDSLSGYAALLKVTPNHLNDTVREQTGQAAGELIRERQLLEAKRLLLHSDLSISEIGYQLNFNDPSYFSRFFRRYTGQTPAAFRLDIREKYQGTPS